VIDRVAAAAAHADNLDHCVLGIHIHQFKHVLLSSVAESKKTTLKFIDVFVLASMPWHDRQIPSRLRSRVVRNSP
jgi:hypothetical protein